MKLLRRICVRWGSVGLCIGLASFLNMSAQAQDIGASIIERAEHAAGMAEGPSLSMERNAMNMAHATIERAMTATHERRGENIRMPEVTSNMEFKGNIEKEMMSKMNHEIAKAIEHQMMGMTEKEDFKDTQKGKDQNQKFNEGSNKDKMASIFFEDKLTKDSSKLSFNKEEGLKKGRTVASASNNGGGNNNNNGGGNNNNNGNNGGGNNNDNKDTDKDKKDNKEEKGGKKK
ncbi:MAG: hypothetical protein A2Z91_08705 [Deltaproteobacteria bacterium GWA2_38_16]|nr:MAG: hypothetical protein A2Z91_08705 [Deltaproteobacteria bacterium GWA2_38_16]OGQ03874.1 MAG: hypothetical protein A3D19_07270 [Deltaproteobacteria bacterium RIFCSPHIGHO2_02_FULL_38_15]OGQ33340.1 MAG: hypothetical protein A3A72_08555 [Deltaproteobacteria bacterium RIFCSPLOWO2_01_FULL_38_9]HBQ20920.1 hypothetical protein [Deltaproteobacteria bacterium]